MRTRLYAFVVTSLGIMAVNARAGIITGVTVTTDMGNGFNSDITHIVDGSGLSALSFDAIHDRAFPSNAWASDDNVLTGIVTFDLNGSYLISGMSVWNFNGFSNAGVSALTVLVSLDGFSFTALAGAPGAFEPANAFAPTPPQMFDWDPVRASFVRFDILSNHNTRTATGLSEVLFDGVRLEATASGTGFLLAAGALLLWGATRKKERSYRASP